MSYLILKLCIVLVCVLSITMIYLKEADKDSEDAFSWREDEIKSLKSWQEANYVKNSAFTLGEGDFPSDWGTKIPNAALSPKLSWVNGPTGKKLMKAEGIGDRNVFGVVKQNLYLNGDYRWYSFKVRFRVEGIDCIHHHLVHAVVGSGNVAIEDYLEEDSGWIVGEVKFKGPGQRNYAEVHMIFRFSAWGKVWWDRVSITEIPAIPPRIVKVAVTWFNGNLSWWSQRLDFAGSKKADIVLLPEFMNSQDPRGAEHIHTGPTFRLLSQKAKQWGMYVTTSIYEKRDQLVYNTAPLYDRQGNLITTYEKVMLYEPELEAGATPGIGLKVVPTDFGNVGFMTCYDSWFPEVARLLAYKGAELVVFPSAAYDMEIMPARAVDNGLWIAASSQGTSAGRSTRGCSSNTSGVWDTAGTFCEEVNKPEKMRPPSRRSPTSFISCSKYEEEYVMIATVDLNSKYLAHWYGTGEGPYRSAPGSSRVRQTLVEHLEEELAREAKRWKQ